jgi:hypothetical protein
MTTAEQKRRAAQQRRGHAEQAVRQALDGNALSIPSVDGIPCLIGPGRKRIMVVAVPDEIHVVAIVTEASEVRMVEVHADA